MISDNVMTDGIKQHIERQDKRIRELQALVKQLHNLACSCEPLNSAEVCRACVLVEASK